MSITFRCEKCHKNVKAPETAGGRRGRCPHCGQTSYIPSPVSSEDTIPLAPLDEQEECERRREIDSLRQAERDLLSETGGPPAIPLEHKDDLASEDLHHFVVNYCTDMFSGNLTRAEQVLVKMKPFQQIAIEAVEDFQTKKAVEPTLNGIPPRVLKGYLSGLKDKLRS